MKKLTHYTQIKTYADFVEFFRCNLVLCNEIVNVDEELIENLDEDDEVFQWYIIDRNTADTLKQFTDELVFYSPKLNVYVWGITHFGISWDYVNIEIGLGKN